MPDILALEKVITHPSLVHCLSSLPIRSPKTQQQMWMKQKRAFKRTSSLIRSLGKPAITAAQAKRLDDLGLGYEDLTTLYRESKDKNVFCSVLPCLGQSWRAGPHSFLRCYPGGGITSFFQTGSFQSHHSAGDLP